jgi:hypothetical protein
MKLYEIFIRPQSIEIAQQNLTGSLVEQKRKFNWPTTIKGDFICHSNKIVCLEGMPDNVLGVVNATRNNLPDLRGCSLSVGKGFICSYNKIATIKYTPHYIKGEFDLSNNKITTLEGIEDTLHTLKGKLIISFNPIQSHISGLLKVEGLEEVVFSSQDKRAYEAFKILNKHLVANRVSESMDNNIERCQQELHFKGLEEFI